MGDESDQAKALAAVTLERDNAQAALAAMTADRDAAVEARDANAAALTAMTGERDAGVTALDAQRTATTAAQGERDDALKLVDEMRQTQSNMSVELGKLRSDLATAKRKTSVVQKGKPAALRDVVEQDDVEDKRALLDTLRSGLHEVVFSIGKQEIASLAPIAVGPEAWQLIGKGVLLREPVTIKPDRTIELGGFGLFDADGKQIAWCAMAQPVTIAAGQPMRLDRQIVF